MITFTKNICPNFLNDFKNVSKKILLLLFTGLVIKYIS